MVTVCWPEIEPARTVGRSITAAVRSTSTAGPAAYAVAATALAELPSAPTGSVLAAVVRMLLEDEHPGGLDGDDIREVLARCVADAAKWLPSAAVSTRVLVAIVSSALGIHEAGVTHVEPRAPGAAPSAAQWVDPEPAGTGDRSSAAVAEPTPPTAAEYNWHAPLLIASLLVVARRPLSWYLDGAFTDIARSEMLEMP